MSENRSAGEIYEDTITAFGEGAAKLEILRERMVYARSCLAEYLEAARDGDDKRADIIEQGTREWANRNQVIRARTGVWD